MTSPPWTSVHGWCWTSLTSWFAVVGGSKQSPTARSEAFPLMNGRSRNKPMAMTAMMPRRIPRLRIRGDHVAVGHVGVVRREKPDEEPGQLAVLRLGDPRCPGEVLKPESRQEDVHLAATPPVVDDANDRDVIGLGRPPESDRRQVVSS